MVESFLDFVKTLPEQGNVRTLSLAELDADAHPFGRPTDTGGTQLLLQHPQPQRRRRRGFRQRPGSHPKIQPYPAAHQRPPRTNAGGSPQIPPPGPPHTGPANYRRQPRIQPQVPPLPLRPTLRQRPPSLPLEPHPPRLRPLLPRPPPLRSLHPRMARGRPPSPGLPRTKPNRYPRHRLRRRSENGLPPAWRCGTPKKPDS